MNGYFSVCRTTRYQHHYIDFLLARYNDLNLKYPFPVSLSYMASPLLMDGAAILCFDDKDEICGACGYIHGTGEKDYEDRHIIQIQVAYLAESCRSTRWFFEGLRFLAEHLSDQEEEIQEILFWVPGDSPNRRLYSKFAELTSTVEQPGSSLAGYRVHIAQLQDYLSSLTPFRERYIV